MLSHFGQMVRAARIVNILLLAGGILLLGGAGPLMATTSKRPIQIVVLGDSLTAGFGVKPGEAFPEQLQRLLAAKGFDAKVANAGVSGDTTAGGLTRLDWAVPEGTDAVILELGANDMLSGLPPERARANLETIIARLKARRIDILLTGMRASRNLGNDYGNAFDRIFPELAEKHGLILYPFFLAGVALDPKLNLPDGMHPNAAGIALIAERIGPRVEELIARVKAQPKAGRD